MIDRLKSKIWTEIQSFQFLFFTFPRKCSCIKLYVTDVPLPQLAEVVEAAALGTPIPIPDVSSLTPSSSSSSPHPTLLQHCTDLDMILMSLNLRHLSHIFAKHKVSWDFFLLIAFTITMFIYLLFA